jgi:hypothetical protein
VKSLPVDEVLFFSDDFSDLTSGWISKADEKRERYYQDGEFVVLIKVDDWVTWAWGATDAYSDFTAEVDVRKISGPQTARIGLIFRVEDNDNFYYFLINSEGQYRVGKRQDGDWGSVNNLRWKASPQIQPGSASNRLQVTCSDDECSFYSTRMKDTWLLCRMTALLQARLG